jgi:dolichol-phosphate mannosyltransferase
VNEVLVTAPIYNEGPRLEKLLERLKQSLPVDCDMLFVDDASTDGSGEMVVRAGFERLRHASRQGCGPSVRSGIQEALARGYPYTVVMAGNGKDDPRLVGRLLKPLRQGGLDLVQGSRYLPCGSHANMPLHRKLGTRAYSALFSLLAGQRITDATNGFRALRTSLLRDPRLDLTQSWLEDYEVESYLLFKSIALGYRVGEAPVTKIYPAQGSYTKMRMVVGWWSHFRPALLLALRLKH